GRGGSAPQGTSLCALIRFRRVSEWAGKPGDLHRDVLVERLCAGQGARPRRGGQCESCLYGAEGGSEPELLLAAGTRGSTAPGGRSSIPQFHDAAGRDRRNNQ